MPITYCETGEGKQTVQLVDIFGCVTYCTAQLNFVV